MNSWANVGDLVFVLGRENEIVPCKVTKKIGTGPNIQLFFETQLLVLQVNIDRHNFQKIHLLLVIYC